MILKGELVTVRGDQRRHVNVMLVILSVLQPNSNYNNRRAYHAKTARPYEARILWYQNWWKNKMESSNRNKLLKKLSLEEWNKVGR